MRHVARPYLRGAVTARGLPYSLVDFEHPRRASERDFEGPQTAPCLGKTVISSWDSWSYVAIQSVVRVKSRRSHAGQQYLLQHDVSRTVTREGAERKVPMEPRHAAVEVARLTVDVWPELGRLLGVGRNKAYELVNSGEIRALRVGRRIVVPQSAVEEYLSGTVRRAA